MWCAEVSLPYTKWNMPTAILAGDVLFASAFEFIAMTDAP